MSQDNVTGKQPLIRYVNRQQMSWRAVDVEKLIGEDHPARAIWTLVGRRARDRFSGKHGEDNEWGDGATAASAECLRLSVGEESLSLPGGQMAAIPRAA
jgi:hypothetical protein